jgi:hypothetical protein
MTSMIGRAFEISARDQAKPVSLVIHNTTDISHLVEICREEIALIGHDIRRHAIPLPRKIVQDRSETGFRVREVAWPPLKSRQDSTEHLKRRSPAPTVVRGVGSRAVAAAQALVLAMAVVRAAKPGPIVVVGIGWLSGVLQRILRLVGKEVIQLEPGYGKSSSWIAAGVLRRPTSRSFLGWLSGDATARLEAASCIVLLNEADSADDLAALFGLEHHAPPIIMPSSSPLGVAASVRVSAGLQNDCGDRGLGQFAIRHGFVVAEDQHRHR